MGNSFSGDVEQQAFAVYAFDDFEFDEGRWELRKGGTPLDVPPKVMQTLGLLLRQRERVVPNEELLETLWYGVAVTEASLLKAIRIARKVLGDDGDAQRFIRTTRGRGYRFIHPVTETRSHTARAEGSAFVAVRTGEEPLFGRTGELGELLAALGGAFNGRGVCVLVSGELGTGKSRLLSAFAAEAGARGARVVTGRTQEEGGAPELWPWIQMVRALSEGEGASITATEVVDMLGHGEAATGHAWPLFENEAARFRFFDAVARLLQRHATRTPVVLLLEDLHGADTATLSLARFVARELSTSRIFVLGTYRLEGPSREPEALGRLLREAREIRLGGLSSADTNALFAFHLGRPPSPDLSLRVHRITEGNPLFVEEIARVVAASGRADIDAFEIPSKVAETVKSRLQSLGEGTETILAVASVIGRTFDLVVLERASGLARDVVLSRLDPALHRRIISRGSGALGEYRFAHAIFREILYEGMASADRAGAHARVADALEEWALAGESPPSALLAHHYFHAALGAKSAKAAHHSKAAGDAAMRAFAYEDAARHYEQASLSLPGSEGAERSELLTAFGHARRLAGEYGLAAALFRRALEDARAAGDVALMARAGLGFAAVRPETGVVNHEVITVLEDLVPRFAATQMSGAAGELESMVLARLATCISLAGQSERAEVLGDRALTLARASANPIVTARALQSHHWGAAWRPGKAGERLAVAQEMIALAVQGGDPSLANEGRIAEITDFIELGRRDAADRAIAEHARVAALQSDASALVNVRVFETMTALLEGRFSEAEELAGKALALGLPLSEGSARNYYIASLFWARLEQGRVEEIEPLFRAGAEAEPDSALVHAALVRVHAETGRLDLARVRMNDVMRRGLVSARGDWATLPCLVHLSAACEVLGDTETACTIASRLTECADSHVVLGPGVVYMGPVMLSIGLCALARAKYEDAIAAFEQARDLALHVRALPSVVRADAHLADALTRRGHEGDSAHAIVVASGALETATRLGMENVGRRLEKLLTRLGRVASLHS